jgi:hypothetical protein
VLYHAVVVGPPPHDEAISQASPQASGDRHRDIDFRGTCGEVPPRVTRARGHRIPRSRKRAMPRERC